MWQDHKSYDDESAFNISKFYLFFWIKKRGLKPKKITDFIVIIVERLSSQT